MPVVLVRESSTQLVMYMYPLDTWHQILYIIIHFKSQKGSMEALNFLAFTA